MDWPDTLGIPEMVEWRGVCYRLMGTRRYYLSQSTCNEERKRPQGLHVAVWETAAGRTVPPGHEINHRDGNTFNNDPENLECLPIHLHRTMPKRMDMEQVRKNLDRIRGLASRWNRSPKGRRWHRQNARRIWDHHRPVWCVCVRCRKPFLASFRDAKYCSE